MCTCDVHQFRALYHEKTAQLICFRGDDTNVGFSALCLLTNTQTSDLTAYMEQKQLSSVLVQIYYVTCCKLKPQSQA